MPPFDRGGDTFQAEPGLQVALDLLDQPLALRGQVGQAAAHGLVGLRVEMAEGEVLQLVPDLLDAHAPGERGVDVQRLLRDATALVLRHELEGAHVVQPIGELDEEHAHVRGDGEQELAEVLALHRPLGDEVEALELGQAVDKPADLGPEHPVDLLQRRFRVLDRVVEDGGDDGGLIEAEVGEDGRDLERMGEEQVAGGARLGAVGAHGVDVGAVQQRLVGAGIVALDPLDELVLTHHRRVVPFPLSRPNELIGKE